MPPKPSGKADASAVVGFRLDAANRDLLEAAAREAKRSIHEEARQRLIESLANGSDRQQENSADLEYLRDRVLLLDDKINDIAKDLMLIAGLILTKRSPTTEEESKEYAKNNFASYSLAQKLSETDAEE